MAEKEITIKVTTETDVKDLTDLKNMLEEMHDKVLQVQLEADTKELELVNSQLEEAKDKLSDLKASVDVDDSEIESLESEISDLEARQIQLLVNTEYTELEEVEARIEELEQKRVEIYMGADDTEIQEVESELDALEARQIELSFNVDMGNLDEINNKLDETETKTQNTTNSIDGLSTAVTGLGAAVGFDRMVTVADNINNSWRRVKYAFDDVGISEEQVKQNMSGLGDATGRTGGQMRDFYSMMGNSGIKNLDAIRQGFETASAGAYKTGNSLEGVENAMQRMIMSGGTGAMMLRRVGITTQDLANAMGVSAEEVSDAFKKMTPEERLNAINKAMNDSKAVNNEFKDSFAALKVQAEAAFAGLLGAIGQAILPIIIPMLQTATQAINMLTDGFKSLPPEVQGIVGAFAGLVLGGTVLITGLGLVGKAVGSVKDGLRTLKSLRTCDSVKNSTKCWKDYKQELQNVASKAKSTAIAIGTTLKSALLGIAETAKNAAIAAVDLGKKILEAGYNAVKAAGMWLIEKAQLIASTIAKGAATVASLALAVAEWLAASPVLLVALAIAGLIVVLWYLYNTCEPVRNAIDAMWAGITSAIQPIIDGVQWLIDKLTQLANGDWTATIEIMKAGASAGIEGLFDVANNDLSRGLFEAIAGEEALAQADEGMPILKEKLKTDFNSMLDSIWNDGTQGFLGWLAGIAGIDVNSYLTGLQTSFNQIPQWVNQASQGAIQSFQGMLNEISIVLNNIITNVINFGNRLVSNIGNAARNAWNSFVNSIAGMWKHMAEEVDAILSQADRLLRELPSKLWNAAVNMVRGWLTGSGEGSPGFMYYAFEEDLGAMEKKAEDNNIADKIGATANNMIDSWGNPHLNFDVGEGNIDMNKTSNVSEITRLLNELIGKIDNEESSEPQLVFNLYGDIDDDKRMEKFLTAVRKELYWNNKTAGRTV